ncbi:MAG: flavin reductase family protein [Salibacteraceae bacterium]
MLSLDPKTISMPRVHGYLLGAIAPRPIAFASTVNAEGTPNLSPFSYFNVFSAKPPVLIFSPARSGRDNTTKNTLDNALATREVVINIVSYPIVQQMSLSSTAYPEGVDEFVKSGLTPIASETVKPFRVKESPVQFECKVNEVVALGQEGGAGNLIICEVQRIHLSEEILDENQHIVPQKLDAVGRMGGNWYCRANGDALFEVTKPLATLGIGVDQIPKDIRNSRVLTGNNLGQLGNVEQLPDETDVNEYKLLELSDLFQDFIDDASRLEQELHKRAHELLNDNQVEDAWKTLLAFNN